MNATGVWGGNQEQSSTVSLRADGETSALIMLVNRSPKKDNTRYSTYFSVHPRHDLAEAFSYLR